MFVVEDNATNKLYVVEDKYELEERLLKEFDVSHDGVEDAIKSLCRKLGYEYTGDEEAFLNISVKL